MLTRVRSLISIPSARSKSVPSIVTWGLVDQVVVSGSNFAVTVMLARSLSMSNFGIFALGYAGLLFANSVQSAIVTQPLSVTVPGIDSAIRDRYVASTFTSQIALSLVGVFVFWLLGLVFYLSGRRHSDIMLLLGLTLLTWQLQEFVRRLYYASDRAKAACFNDLVSYGGQVVLIIALSLLTTVTVVSAIAVIGITSFMAFAIAIVSGTVKCRVSIHRQDVRDNWKLGKWLMGATLGYWLSMQMFMFVVAFSVGAAAAGAIRASQTLMGPVLLLFGFLESVLPVQFRQVYANAGSDGLKRLVRRATALSMPPIAIYCIAVSIAAPLLLRSVFGREYSQYSLLVTLMGIYYILMAISRIFASAIQAIHLVKPIFTGYALTTALSLTCGVFLVLQFGVLGSLVGIILNAVVLAAVMTHSYFKAVP